jgi:hypothetical protein
LAQGTAESWIELGYTRNLVIEDRRAVGDGAVSLAKRATRCFARCIAVLTAKAAVPTARGVDAWCGRRGRGRRRGRGPRQLVAENGGDRHDDD